ncbi:MAG: hypothetical protein PHF05_06050, partial [Candidatus Izemoplasmatales bacterium]|nr:hypothetical protein [Candidatus Izemoplasmatales bacterium]
YQYEMRLRRVARYSPFYYLIEIGFNGKSIRDVFYAGIEFSKQLKRFDESIIVLGPAIDQTIKIKNRYTAKIMIKYREKKDFYEKINELVDSFSSDDIYISIDNYPNVG